MMTTEATIPGGPAQAGPVQAEGAGQPEAARGAPEYVPGADSPVAPSPRIIAFFNLKGGVGKTTACVNLAAVLQGKVLVVDLDPTACATHFLGVFADFQGSVGAALLGVIPLEKVCCEIRPGLRLAPAAAKLAMLERLTQRARPDRLNAAGSLSDFALASAIGELSLGAYDYVLVDCPGGHPCMTRQALMAADEVIVPTGLSVTDLYAAAPTLDLVQKAQALRGDGRPSLLGFLPTGAGHAGLPAKMQTVLETYGLPCFTPIRASAVMKTLPGRPDIEHRLIVNWRPGHPTAQSYRRVAEEIEYGIDETRERDGVSVIDAAQPPPPGDHLTRR